MEDAPILNRFNEPILYVAPVSAHHPETGVRVSLAQVALEPSLSLVASESSLSRQDLQPSSGTLRVRRVGTSVSGEHRAGSHVRGYRYQHKQHLGGLRWGLTGASDVGEHNCDADADGQKCATPP